MPYSTIDDQTGEIPLVHIQQLVDDTEQGITHAQVVARFNQIRDESDSEIDAMLSVGGYSTPVTGPPAALVLLRSWSKGLTGYKLFKRKDTMPEVRQKEFDRINKLLEKISLGLFKLPEKPADIDTGFACGALVTSHFDSQ